MDTYSISFIILMLFISAISAGVEVAYIASDKLMVELDKNKNNILSRILTFILNKPSHILGTTLLCTTTCMVVSSSYMSDIVENLVNPILPSYLQNEVFILIINTLIITIITLIFAEFIPKSIFILSPNKFLYIFSVPLFLTTILLYPIVSVIIYISNFFLKYVFKQKYIEDKIEFELKDFHSFLQKSINIQRKTPTIMRAKMASKVINFKKVRIRDCMIPRTEIIAVDIKESIDALKKVFSENEFSKILIFENDIDNIIGYCHLKDLLKKPKMIDDILLPVTVIPETNLASDIMIDFINENKTIAIVVDEFGGTAGMITLEDIIEEIFGEIQDEHDIEDLIEKKISKDSYILSARHEIDYLNEKYQWKLPTGEYETVGGLITQIAGYIPKKNEIIETDNFKFIILEMKKTHLKTVKLIIKKNNI